MEAIGTLIAAEAVFQMKGRIPSILSVSLGDRDSFAWGARIKQP
jgi:hypothetical protein